MPTLLFSTLALSALLWHLDTLLHNFELSLQLDDFSGELLPLELLLLNLLYRSLSNQAVPFVPDRQDATIAGALRRTWNDIRVKASFILAFVLPRAWREK